MSAMSDLHLLAENIKKRIEEDGLSLYDAVQAVSADTSYEQEDVIWAYKQRYE